MKLTPVGVVWLAAISFSLAFWLAVVYLLSVVIVGVAVAQDDNPRTEAHEHYTTHHAELSGAVNGVATQCEADIALFVQHENTQPAGQAAYDASGRKATASAHKAAAEAIAQSVYDRLNNPHPGNVPPALPGIGPNESVLGKAYELYAAGDDGCIPLLNFAATLCELAALDVATFGTMESQNRFDENGEYNDWLANQGGGSGGP